MPDDLAALYERMGEGMGIFHRFESLCCVLGDGDLPRGLEEGICAGGLAVGCEAKVPATAATVLLPACKRAKKTCHTPPPSLPPTHARTSTGGRECSESVIADAGRGLVLFD